MFLIFSASKDKTQILHSKWSLDDLKKKLNSQASQCPESRPEKLILGTEILHIGHVAIIGSSFSSFKFQSGLKFHIFDLPHGKCTLNSPTKNAMKQ